MRVFDGKGTHGLTNMVRVLNKSALCNTRCFKWLILLFLFFRVSLYSQIVLNFDLCNERTEQSESFVWKSGDVKSVMNCTPVCVCVLYKDIFNMF